LFWLGLGSNLLVRDGGIRGAVVALASALNNVHVYANGIEVLAGTPCAKVARFCAREGYAGASFFAGIPGTMGGALAMNAGAFGGETWPLVEAVQTLDEAGQSRWRSATDYSFGYRSVDGPHDSPEKRPDKGSSNEHGEEWFIACRLRLTRASADERGRARDDIKALLARRAKTQPTGQRSCGSVFRNPPGDYSGRLIEAAGLKGRRIGGALVSPKHANFIINEDNASAADIESLMTLVGDQVEARFGVRLVPEVRIVGEAA
jgi:UDP-N-acetylmuramate dehydrogenase